MSGVPRGYMYVSIKVLRVRTALVHTFMPFPGSSLMMAAPCGCGFSVDLDMV